MRIALSLAFTFAVLVAQTAAWACDGAEKAPQFLTQGPLPANARGVLWWSGGTSYVVGCDPASSCRPTVPSPTEWVVSHHGRGPALLVPHAVKPFFVSKGQDGVERSETMLILPTGGFVAGARYTFRGPADTQLELTVSTAPLDSGPASLAVAEEVRGPIQLGQPFGKPTPGVRRDLTLTLPGPAVRFEGALAYETTIDGRRWHPTTDPCDHVASDRSGRGRGADRLAVACAGSAGPLVPGKTHQVTMRAVLPGTEIALTGNGELVLRCEGASSQGGCGSCALAPACPRATPWLLLALAACTAGRRRRSRRARQSDDVACTGRTAILERVMTRASHMTKQHPT